MITQKRRNCIIACIFWGAIINMPVYGQLSTVTNYLESTGNYAAIYRGEIELFYNPYTYKSVPYYISSDFATGDLYYNKRYYPSQRMRLDTYKGQLMLLTPNNHSIILDFTKVEKAQIHDKDIITHYPPESSGLKPGYYISLFVGETLRLLLRDKREIRLLPSQVEYTFDKSINYYLIYDGKYHTVRNRKSYTKLFPKFKKQIKQYAKAEKLNFREDREYSLISLARYCNQLINSQTHSQ